MTDDIELSLIEVLRKHLTLVRECPCGKWIDTGPHTNRVIHNYAEHIAENIIKDLGFK